MAKKAKETSPLHNCYCPPKSRAVFHHGGSVSCSEGVVSCDVVPRQYKIAKGISKTSIAKGKYNSGAGSKPCSESRKTCPVQLVFRDGDVKLRFCKGLNQPGYLVPVSSPEEAIAISQAACAEWAADAKAFSERNTAVVASKGQLGSVRAKKRTRK